LDVGSGTGVLVPFLLKAVGPAGHITIIDFAEKMAEICKAKYAHYPNLRIVVDEGFGGQALVNIALSNRVLEKIDKEACKQKRSSTLKTYSSSSEN
jgi:tRNA A58 N-methylase Trm61